MDRNRPLWEIWIIEGVSDDRWAMVMKVHHCVADGIATAHMLAGLSGSGIPRRFALKIMGRKAIAVMPIPPIPMRLHTVPDVDELARGVEVAVARLPASSKRRRRTRDERGLSLVVNG